MSDMHRLIEEKLNALSPIEIEVIKLRVLREFVKELLELWDFSNDIDGGEFQDLAVKHHVLVEETHTHPCSRDDEANACTCEEYYGDDFGEGVTCYRYAEWMKYK